MHTQVFLLAKGDDFLTKREHMLALLHGESDMIPSWTQSFFSVNTAVRLIGNSLVSDDILPSRDYKKGAVSRENRLKNLKLTKKLDNYSIGVGKGGNFFFGHGGPGEFRDKIIQLEKNKITSRFETGVKKEIKFEPYFYEMKDHLVQGAEDIEKMILPNPLDEKRYEGVKEDVDFYKKAGYFVYANLNGFFSGLHYFFCPYDKLLLNMALNPDFIMKMLKNLGEFNLAAAEQLLKCGVDCITFCEDMGSGNSLLFSPEMYEYYFFPWHKQLADLCHDYKAFLHMHSHGNINKIIDKIFETGIDMINPIDPYENMMLEELFEKSSGKQVLVGGINKFFFEWDRETKYEFLKKVIRVGKKYRKFILMDSGGIPDDLAKDEFEYYLKISRKLRYR